MAHPHSGQGYNTNNPRSAHLVWANRRPDSILTMVMNVPIRTLAALATILVATAASPTLAATLHVSPSGSNTATGTSTDPWSTIQQAMNAAAPGDTIQVGAGVYDEIVRTPTGGAPGNPLVIDGGGQATVMRFAIDKPFVTVQNFRVVGPASAGYGAIEIGKGGHYTVLSNNVVDLGKKLGVHGLIMTTEIFDRATDTNAARHCLIISNYFGNVLGGTALQIAGRYNTIRLNTVTNVYSSDFIRLFGHTNLIQNNQFLNNIYQAGVGNHADFIQTFGDNRQASLGHVIDANIVSNIIGGQLSQLTMVNSFYDKQHGGWTFKNNIFVDIELQASAGIPHLRWLHNAFIRCSKGGHPIAMGYTEGRGNSEGAVILNNTFIDCGRIDSNIAGWYSVPITNMVADYNYVGKNGFGPVRQESVASAFRWFEPNGINGGDPRFANLKTLDLRLLATSPLINRGMAHPGTEQDHWGNARPLGNAPDIGIFEYPVGDRNPNPTAPRNLRVVSQP